MRRILIIAYACEPQKGSEPEVGWKWAQEISKFFDVWVVTRANNRKVIEDYLKKTPNPNLNFIYIDLPKWARFWKKGPRGVRLYYYLWQIYGVFKVKKEIKLESFDAIHHVTFVSDYMPSFFFLLKLVNRKLKLIWGPLGGNDKIPLSLLSWENKFLEIIKRILRWVLRISPFFLITKRLADYAIFINDEVRRKIAWKSKPYKIIPAISVESPVYNSKRSHSEIKIVFAGNFIPIKNIILVLRVFDKFLRVCKREDIKLYMIGKGKEKKKAQRFVTKRRLDKYVEFIEWLDREELFKFFCTSHIFFFPSLEAGGMVVLEAMAHGLPVVCLDYGGPGEIVDETSGIKVKISSSYKEVVNNLVNALLTLVENEELRERLGEGARRRVKLFYSWEAKGKEIKKIYRYLGLL